MPNYFTDISQFLDKKLLALKAYDSEMRDWPHPRSYKNIINVAEVRGAQVGFDAAEAFECIRILR